MTTHLYSERFPEMPNDQELALLADYVGGFMTDAQVRTFEERMTDDVEFFARMEPFLDAWYARGVLPVEVAIAKRLDAEGPPRLPLLRRRMGNGRVVLAWLAAAAVVGFALFPFGCRADAPKDRVAQHYATAVAKVAVRDPSPLAPADSLVAVGESAAEQPSGSR